MKVNGFQVEEHGSGYALTIRLHVGKDEVVGVSVNMLMQAWQDRVAAMELGFGDGGARIKPETIEATQPETSAPKTSRRRRISRDTKADAGTKAEDPTLASSAGPSKRRRRSLAAQSEPASGAKTRREGAPAASTTSSAVSSPGKITITDEDLSKAASEAARRTKSPAKVMALLADMGVAKVNELEGRNRGEFLERAKGLK